MYKKSTIYTSACASGKVAVGGAVLFAGTSAAWSSRVAKCVCVRSRAAGARHTFISAWCCEGALVLQSRLLVGLSQPADARWEKVFQHEPPEVHFETQSGSLVWRGIRKKA